MTDEHLTPSKTTVQRAYLLLGAYFVSVIVIQLFPTLDIEVLSALYVFLHFFCVPVVGLLLLVWAVKSILATTDGGERLALVIVGIVSCLPAFLMIVAPAWPSAVGDLFR